MGGGPRDSTDSTDKLSGSEDGAKNDLSRVAWDELKTEAVRALSAIEKVAGQVLQALDLPSPFEAASDKKDKPATEKAQSADVEIEIKAPLDKAYRGEGICRQVEPADHTVSKDETISQIAREHLGKGASEELVKKYVKEIADSNGLLPDDKLTAGTVLMLPGHTADGGFVMKDGDGNKIAVWQNGSRRVENRDGSGYQHKVEADGSYSEKHWGKHAEDNYELSRTKDGRYLVSDRQGEKAVDRTGSNDIRVQRAALDELAESKIFDPRELAKFHSDMQRFEERARNQGVRVEEVPKTYREVSRILQFEGKKPLPAEDRAVVAEQIIAQAADPTGIDQGYHNTCTVTSVEKRLYGQSPSDVARLVADVATTGQFTAADGKVIRPNPESLQADLEAGSNPPGDNKRSHASQIFQVTAENIAWAEISAGRKPPVDYRYEQRQEDPTGNPPDSGERLVDYSKKPPQVLINQAGKEAEAGALITDRMIQVSNLITGRDEKNIVIANADSAGGDTQADHVASEKDLQNRVAEAKREGRLPLMVVVYVENEPFWSDSGGGKAGGFGSSHVCTITDYDEKTGKISVDNQWGKAADHLGGHGLSAHELYLATKLPSKSSKQS